MPTWLSAHLKSYTPSSPAPKRILPRSVESERAEPAGARLILAPDWKPIRWSEAERKKGQAWRLKTIESFHTYGTPPVEPTGGH